MANKEHLKIIQQGFNELVQWRYQNKGVRLDLSGADLRGIKIYALTVFEADLRAADLSETKLERVIFDHSDLSGANLSKSILKRSSFDHCILHGTNLTGCLLHEGSFKNADLTGSDFSKADLRRANFTKANLTKINLSSANLTGTIFTNAQCSNAVFSDVDLSTIKKLDTVEHILPSVISADTLIKSRGEIPADFLAQCHVPVSIINALPYLIQGKLPNATPNSIFGPPVDDEKLRCDIFMVMPFAAEFTSIYEDHIKRLAENLGYTIRRGDDFFRKTSIMTDIWSAINNSKLIIAECTGRNANVFYELGIAHTLDKAVIMLTQKVDDVPFDTKHLRLINYDPAEIEKLDGKLRKAINELIG